MQGSLFAQETMRRILPACQLLVPVQGLAMMMWLASCTTPAQVGQYPNQKGLVGQSWSAVLNCAGPPQQHMLDGERTILRYYREAPILEESRPVGKGSFATTRHGCWATLILTHDHVVDVQYRFVPSTFDASNDCEEIFDSCLR